MSETTRKRGLRVLTSESVTEGHPDKVCDYIADSILDAHLAGDPKSRVACEVLCKGGRVVVAGEITSQATPDIESTVRRAIRSVGYRDPEDPFHDAGVTVDRLLTRQASEIQQGVDSAEDAGTGSKDQGAGDQGIMYGYASSETPELMPLPIVLAHRLTAGLAHDRKTGRVDWLRPDGKSQVSVAYDNGTPLEVETVLVSTQHAAGVDRRTVAEYVRQLSQRVLGDWYNERIQFVVDPTGSFVFGGPSVDCGVTGRKLIVDTYGGAARIGGGALSGKDPSKVDRSAAYYCRWIARQAVHKGMARKVEVQVAYAIGRAKPLAVNAETFGTGDEEAVVEFVKSFDFRPAAIIERLDLLRPIYRETTNYGHFGRAGLPWEE